MIQKTRYENYLESEIEEAENYRAIADGNNEEDHVIKWDRDIFDLKKDLFTYRYFLEWRKALNRSEKPEADYSDETVRDLHHKAMAFVDDAIIQRNLGNLGSSAELFIMACSLEEQAAIKLPVSPDSEPTRGILYRSAASMAMNAYLYERALGLVIEGLRGYPLPEFKRELLEVYDAIKEKQNG